MALTEDQKAPFRAWGRQGGLKRKAKLSKKRRRQIALKAVRAREAKRRLAAAQ